MNITLSGDRFLDSGFLRLTQPHDITKSFHTLYMEVMFIVPHNGVINDLVSLLFY